MPQLLVSVRSEQEATAAIAGGCDIVDIKEPNHGSLGRASFETINEIVEVCSLERIPVSAALGELPEWSDRDQRSVPNLSQLPIDLSYAKVGLAGMGNRPNWEHEWLQLLNSKPTENSHSWIAVAYADHLQANSPTVCDVLDVVTGIGAGTFAGFLIDTFDKSSGNLFDCMSLDELVVIRKRLKQAGLLMALAGKLDQSLVATLANISPDVVAIRGAACEGSDRTSSVSQSRVAEFRQSLFLGEKSWQLPIEQS